MRSLVVALSIFVVLAGRARAQDPEFEARFAEQEERLRRLEEELGALKRERAEEKARPASVMRRRRDSLVEARMRGGMKNATRVRDGRARLRRYG